MTTGRINQVATSRVLRSAAQTGQRIRIEVRKCVWMFDCVLASVSQLSCTTAPLQRLRQPRGGEAPPEERALLHQRCEIQSLLGAPPSCASGCVKLCGKWFKKGTIDPYNSKTRAQVIQSRTSWHSMLESKKRKANRRFANQAFARCHPEAETRNRRGCYKAKRRRTIE